MRNASIISDDETDMLVIDRDLFNTTLKVRHVALFSFINKLLVYLINFMADNCNYYVIT